MTAAKHRLLCGPCANQIVGIEDYRPEVRLPVPAETTENSLQRIDLDPRGTVHVAQHRYIRHMLAWGDVERYIYVWEHATPEQILEALEMGTVQ